MDGAVVITNHTLTELKLILASIDKDGYQVVAMVDQGLAFAPFRMCFAFNNDPIMYGVVQTDLALEFDINHYMGWLQSQLPVHREWIANAGVTWSKLYQMIELKLHYEQEIDEDNADEDDETVVYLYSVPSNRTHQCWTLFNQYWERFFPQSPVDLAWS